MSTDPRDRTLGSAAPPRPTTRKPQAVRTSSRALFGDGEVVLIEHGAETYVLRQTRQGKLILTK